MFNISREYRYVNIGILIVIFVIILLPFILNIKIYMGGKSYLNHDSVKCFYLSNMGKPCFFCGMTRSLLSLYRGDFDLSRQFHPGGSYILVGLSFQFFLRFFWLLLRTKFVPLIDIAQLVLCSIFVKSIIEGFPI